MGLQEVGQRTAEPHNTEPQNFEGWIRLAQSSSIKLAAFAASGGAEPFEPQASYLSILGEIILFH